MPLRYIRCLTWRRILNVLRCRLSYLFGRSYRHYPTFVALEPADWCMLRCPQCPVGCADMPARNMKEKHVMTPELYRRIIDEIAPYTHTVIFHFQGEPLLSPYLADMVSYAHERRMFTMFSTNAQLLTTEVARALAEAGLDRIIISIDGLTQATYEHYRRGGSLQRALISMRALADLPKNIRPEIVLQCLRLRSNEQEWKMFEEQYNMLGADRLEMKTAQFYDFSHGNDDMPTDSRFCRYEKRSDGLWYIKNPLHNRCYRLWSGCVITAEGEVRPCCYDKSGKYALGSLYSISRENRKVKTTMSSLGEVLHSKVAEDFRTRVFSSRKDIDICCNCDE